MRIKFLGFIAATSGCISSPSHQAIEIRTLSIRQVASQDAEGNFEFQYCDNASDIKCDEENAEEEATEPGQKSESTESVKVEENTKAQPVADRGRILTHVTHKVGETKLTSEQELQVLQAVADIPKSMRFVLTTYVSKTQGGYRQGTARIEEVTKVLNANGVTNDRIWKTVRLPENKQVLMNTTFIEVKN